MKTLIATAICVALLPVGLLVLLGAGPITSCPPVGAPGSVPALDGQRAANARTIVAVGRSRVVPTRGLVVAVATALQESGLRNLRYGDRDSLGLFQQRPSQGWGSPAQILDPASAATRFFTALLRVPGWQRLPVAAAAQAVQRSALADAYAKRADEAARIVAALTGSPTVDATACGEDVLSAASVSTVLRFAAARVGDRYVLGANGPNSWDCSSLVQAAYETAGVQLPRTAAEQYDFLHARGDVIAGPATLASLRAGDLLFSRGSIPHPTATGELVGHVALYAGSGVVIEAKGWASGVTAQHYTGAALSSISAIGRLTTPTASRASALNRTLPERRLR
jgi:cell wall-associated NlpC family hydrolase